jgi:hypothetical protein
VIDEADPRDRPPSAAWRYIRIDKALTIQERQASGLFCLIGLVQMSRSKRHVLRCGDLFHPLPLH